MKKHIRQNSVLSAALSLLLTLALVLSSIMPMTAVVSYAEADNETSVSDEAAEDTQNGEAVAENVPEKKKAVTNISNYETTYNKLLGEPLEISADIDPAGEREVQLQRYSSAEDSWSVIRTEKAETRISIEVPAEDRNNTNSLWRIYAPATDDAEEAYSDNIKVISENLKELDMSAAAACIYRIEGDGKGNLIYSKDADVKRAQASTTKLMTAILLLESGLIDNTTEISYHAATTPWGSGRLEAGDVYNNRDLLYAMLLPSSNDAATAVAEGVGGTEAKFVCMMNDKAEEMGLTDTHFCNPHGLDADGHYTTAAELAKLTAYAYTFPEIKECWATSYKTIKSVKKGKKWTLWSTNAIFGYISNFLGGKTGTEDNAGCCFTGIYTYDGYAYVTVVLGSGYGFSRWSDTKKLHQYIRDYAATRY